MKPYILKGGTPLEAYYKSSKRQVIHYIKQDINNCIISSVIKFLSEGKIKDKYTMH